MGGMLKLFKMILTVLNQFSLIDVFLIVIRIDFPLFFLLPCKLLHVCLRNEF